MRNGSTLLANGIRACGIVAQLGHCVRIKGGFVRQRRGSLQGAPGEFCNRRNPPSRNAYDGRSVHV